MQRKESAIGVDSRQSPAQLMAECGNRAKADMPGTGSNDQEFRRQLALDFQWDDRVDFAGFVAGENAEAVAALQHNLGSEPRRLIYLYGEPGVGKSHLLQAACSAASTHGQTVVYLQLTELISRPAQLLDGLEMVEVTVLDDLDRLAGNSDWQEATFHLFNRLQEAGRDLLMAGSRRPGELNLSLPDLVSRLQCALILRLDPLNDKDKLQALHTRALRRGLELPRLTAQYLLNHYPRDTGYLLRLLDELDAASLQAQRRLTIPFLKRVLQEKGEPVSLWRQSSGQPE